MVFFQKECYNLCLNFFILIENELVIMPYISKHTDQTVESLVNDIIQTLEKHQATTELSLMVLGNTLTHLFKTQIHAEQRAEFVQKFNDILVQSTL